MKNDLRPLTQEQRQAARQAAGQAVVRSIGPRPAREHFAHHTISKYPPTVTRLIGVLPQVNAVIGGSAVQCAEGCCLLHNHREAAIGFSAPIAAASRPNDGAKNNSQLAVASSTSGVLC